MSETTASIIKNIEKNLEKKLQKEGHGFPENNLDSVIQFLKRNPNFFINAYIEVGNEEDFIELVGDILAKISNSDMMTLILSHFPHVELDLSRLLEFFAEHTNNLRLCLESKPIKELLIKLSDDKFDSIFIKLLEVSIENEDNIDNLKYLLSLPYTRVIFSNYIKSYMKSGGNILFYNSNRFLPTFGLLAEFFPELLDAIHSKTQYNLLAHVLLIHRRCSEHKIHWVKIILRLKPEQVCFEINGRNIIEQYQLHRESDLEQEKQEILNLLVQAYLSLNPKKMPPSIAMIEDVSKSKYNPNQQLQSINSLMADLSLSEGVPMIESELNMQSLGSILHEPGQINAGSDSANTRDHEESASDTPASMDMTDDVHSAETESQSQSQLQSQSSSSFPLSGNMLTFRSQQQPYSGSQPNSGSQSNSDSKDNKDKQDRSENNAQNYESGRNGASLAISKKRKPVDETAVFKTIEGEMDDSEILFNQRKPKKGRLI